jgi:hypothetical protein
LHYWEGGIGGVVSCKQLVALLWGEWTLSIGCAYGEAIDEKLGPFDIGLGRRGRGVDSS